MTAKEKFISSAISAAQRSSARSGFPAGVTVAQAALESAWGASLLARKANNYFGIKAGPGGPSLALATTEFVSGESRKVTARFARYPSMEACFSARDQIILTAPCYAEARGHAGEPIAFIHSVARYWATDPGYAEKLEQLYLANQFSALDRQPAPASAASTSTATSPQSPLQPSLPSDS